MRHKYEKDRPDAIFIEDKSSGQTLNQEFQDNPHDILPLIIFDPEDKSEEGDEWRAWFRMDKHARASLVQPLWQSKRVSYDPHMDGAAELIEEFATFPNGAHDDRVDAGVHAVRYLSRLLLRLSKGNGHQDEAEEATEDIQAGL